MLTCRYVFTSNSGHGGHFLSLSNVGNTSQNFLAPVRNSGIWKYQQHWAAPGVINTCQVYTNSASQPPGTSRKKDVGERNFVIILPQDSQSNSNFLVLPNFRVGILAESFLNTENKTWKPMKSSVQVTLLPKLQNGTDSLRTNSITPIIRNNWDGEPSGLAENPDNWIFLSK